VIDKRDGVTTTSLIIAHAETIDSGTYTCNPSSHNAKKVVVHVTTGQNIFHHKNIFKHFSLQYKKSNI
jgi:hypothetical protein